MREVAALAPWRAAIGEVAALRTAVLSIDHYYDLLAAEAGVVDVWRTAYQHPMASPASIVEWVSGTGLRPFVDPLDAPQRAGFLAEYERRIEASYPVRADGRRLLAFPRLFIVARCPG